MKNSPVSYNLLVNCHIQREVKYYKSPGNFWIWVLSTSARFLSNLQHLHKPRSTYHLVPELTYLEPRGFTVWIWGLLVSFQNFYSIELWEDLENQPGHMPGKLSCLLLIKLKEIIWQLQMITENKKGGEIICDSALEAPSTITVCQSCLVKLSFRPEKQSQTKETMVTLESNLQFQYQMKVEWHQPWEGTRGHLWGEKGTLK